MSMDINVTVFTYNNFFISIARSQLIEKQKEFIFIKSILHRSKIETLVVSRTQTVTPRFPVHSIYNVILVQHPHRETLGQTFDVRLTFEGHVRRVAQSTPLLERSCCLFQINSLACRSCLPRISKAYTLGGTLNPP